tara:strand:+ start:366 stop:1094 length:729 start_codon:yes stop_codon:yes gene_type:complete
MNKNFHFLCPMPRSGQTYINMILNKSEQLQVSANSILPNIFFYLNQSLDTNIYKNFPYKTGLQQIVKNVFNNYYSNVKQNTILDNAPWGTPYNLNILQSLFKERKFIIYNRPVLECLASFVKVEKPDNVEQRCDKLMELNGRVHKSFWAIENLKKTEKFIEFNFNEIINDTETVIQKIFKYLNLEPEKLSHDVKKFSFDNVEYDDTVLFGPLHNLEPDPDPHNYKDVLPRSVIDKYKHFDGL